MKALTWKQPYAALMLEGKIETRSWQTNYRGLVLICAAKKEYTDQQLDEIIGMRQLIRIINTQANSPIKSSYKGMAIGVGLLTDCRKMTLADEDKCFVDYKPHLYCHIYKNVRAIEPIPWKGSQGWRDVPKEVIKQIKYL